MMNAHPLYGSYWNLPSRPRKAPTVREIPVHYVGSEQPAVDRSASALKIQKVFRGFRVRKSVKRIAEIRSQVEEIERRMAKEESLDLIRRDAKERLRVNEMLMSLLFKLDSVRGVDSGVRECRKTVIKKAISLQEALDAVASSNGDHNAANGENLVETVEQAVTVTECTEENAVDDKEIVKSDQNDGVEEDEEREVVENYEVMPSVSDCPEPEESVGTSQTEFHPPSLIEACEEDDNESMSSKQEIDDTETNRVEEREVVVKESEVPRAGEENPRNRELLERMMEDNEKMMDLMGQLFERNEMQTRLLSSLSRRVEQLEKAFMCERLRKKKKRQAAGTVDCCETTPDSNKCGKR